MDDILNKLALDAWYKVLVYVGAIFFGVGLLNDVRVITNGQLMLLGSGLFFIGVGEWKNRKVISEFKEANAYTGPAGILSAKIRKPDMLGRLFDAIGVLLVVLAVWQIVEPYAKPFIEQYMAEEKVEEAQSNQSPKPTQ